MVKNRAETRALQPALIALALAAALGGVADLSCGVQEPVDESSAAERPQAGNGEEGGATPEETFEKAVAVEDFGDMLSLVAPANRGMAVIDLFDFVAVGCAQDPDEWAVACEVLERHGLHEAAQAAVEAVTAEAAIAYPDRLEAEEARATATFSEVDVPRFARDLMQALGELGMSNDPPPPPDQGEPSGSRSLESLQVDGDRAVGRAGEDEIVFVRVGGRWYLERP